MKEFIEKEFEKNEEKGFIIESDELIVDVFAGRVISWSNFQAGNLHFDLSENTGEGGALISLTGGTVKGDLIVCGAGSYLERLDIDNCSIEERVILSYLMTNVIKVVGRSDSLHCYKSYFRELYLCGDFGEKIMMDNLGGEAIEINVRYKGSTF